MRHISNFIIILCLTISLAAIVCSADRNPQWDNLRDECVIEQKVCQWCGTDKDLEGHHIIEFSYNPKYEMLKENIIVLCRKDHYQIGHGGVSWSKGNPYVKEECDAHREHIKHYAWKIKQLESQFDEILKSTGK